MAADNFSLLRYQPDPRLPGDTFQSPDPGEPERLFRYAWMSLLARAAWTSPVVGGSGADMLRLPTAEALSPGLTGPRELAPALWGSEPCPPGSRRRFWRPVGDEGRQGEIPITNFELPARTWVPRVGAQNSGEQLRRL